MEFGVLLYLHILPTVYHYIYITWFIYGWGDITAKFQIFKSQEMSYQQHPHQSQSHHLKSFKHKPHHRLLTRPISLRADISGETIAESFGQFWRLDVMLVMSFYEVI